MDGDVISRMRTEEADLLRKLKAVRDFLEAYGVGPAKAQVTQRTIIGAPPPVRNKVGIDGFSDYGQRIVAESMRALLCQEEPLKSRQIVEFVEAMGLTITGENKVNALGALLYRSADVESLGKAGWRLRDPESAAKIVAQYGQNETGAATAAPKPEEVGASSNDTAGGLSALMQ